MDEPISEKLELLRVEAFQEKGSECRREHDDGEGLSKEFTEE